MIVNALAAFFASLIAEAHRKQMDSSVFIVAVAVVLGLSVGALALLFVISPIRARRLIARAGAAKGKVQFPPEVLFVFLTACFVFFAYLGTASRNSAPGLRSPTVSSTATPTPIPKISSTVTPTPLPVSFKQVAASLAGATDLNAPSVTVATILKPMNVDFTRDDEQELRYSSDMPLPTEKFEALRARFEPVQEELVQATKSENASDGLKSLVLIILAKATSFDSPGAHKLLEDELRSQTPANRNSALNILSKLPKKKLPAEILPLIERYVAGIGVDKTDPMSQFKAMQSLRHFEPENLPLIETLTNAFGGRTSEYLYDVNGGWHSAMRTMPNGYVCVPYRGGAMRDSFTYEFARQLSNYSGDIAPLLLRLAKSSNATFHHLVFETLMARSELSDRDLPIIRALAKTIGEDVTSKLQILSLRIRIPGELALAKREAEEFFRSDAAKACEGEGGFKSLRERGKL